MKKHESSRPGKKVDAVATDLMREKGDIAFVDVFMKLAYLDKADYEA